MVKDVLRSAFATPCSAVKGVKGEVERDLVNEADRTDDCEALLASDEEASRPAIEEADGPLIVTFSFDTTFELALTTPPNGDEIGTRSGVILAATADASAGGRFKGASGRLTRGPA